MNRFRKPKHLSRFLVLSTAALAAIPFAAFFLVASITVDRVVLNNALSAQKFLAETLAEETKVKLDATDTVIETIAAHIDSGNLDPQKNQAAVADYCRAVLANNNIFSAIWLLEASSGIVRTTVPSNEGALGFDMSRSDSYLADNEQDAAWSRIGLNPFFPGVTVAVSIRADDFIVIGWIESEALTGLLKSRRIGKEGFAFACDPDGLLVAHPDRALVERRESLFSIPAVREAAQGVPSFSRSPEQVPPFRTLLYVTHPVDHHAWIVGVVENEAEIRSGLPLIAGGGLIAFLFSILFIVISSRRAASILSEHLAELMAGTQAASRGLYQLDIHWQPFVEFETLRSSFMAMLDAIREREGQFRAIFDNSPVVMVINRLEDGSYIDVNQSFIDFSGKTREELLERQTNASTVLFDPKDLENMRLRFEIDGQLNSYESKTKTRQGKTRYLLISAYPITYEGEACIVSIILDITDRKRIEQRIKNLNKELERKVETRTMALQETNEELQVTLESLEAAQSRIIESEKLTALGHLSAGIAHELNTPLGAIISANRSLIDILDTKLLGFIEYSVNLNKSERDRFIRIMGNIAPLISNIELEPIGREQKKALRLQLEAQGIEEAEEKSSELFEIGIARISDDFIDILREEGSLVTLRRCVELLTARRLAALTNVASQRAATVVAALRSYLRKEISEELETVDVETDIENVLTLMRNRIKHKIRIIREYGGIRALGSSEKFSQIWMNLITNAIQAMDYQGDLILRTSYEGNRAVVEVIDSGTGIPEEIQPRVFEPFFTTKPHGEGMGLGLDICRKIVENYNGTISFESRPGRTAFTVRLRASPN